MNKKIPVEPHKTPWRKELYDIIFGTEKPVGKLFDIVLLWAIFISVIVVLLESVEVVQAEYGRIFFILEWFFTLIFTVEYIVRCICVRNPFHYMRSFFGIIDFLSIIPTYVSLILAGAQSLAVIRALRLLRIFRVLKLGRYLGELDTMIGVIKASKRKILVFLAVILTLVIITGTCMYLLEGGQNGFTSIPESIYWSIVTMTTVGYGDIAPKTVFGQFLASIIMIMGYALIVVPTGIFSVELSKSIKADERRSRCSKCGAKEHLSDAIYCCRCGEKL